MRDWLPEGEHPFKELYSEYAKIHDANNADSISKTLWSYSCYASGERIEDSIRIAYRMDYDVMFSVEDPFEFGNAFFDDKLKVGKFIKRSRGILSKAINVIRTQGFGAFTKKVLRKIIS
jgi:hypothetical protein